MIVLIKVPTKFVMHTEQTLAVSTCLPALVCMQPYTEPLFTEIHDYPYCVLKVKERAR